MFLYPQIRYIAKNTKKNERYTNKYFVFAPIKRIFMFELWKITQSSIIAQFDGYFGWPTLKLSKNIFF